MLFTRSKITLAAWFMIFGVTCFILGLATHRLLDDRPVHSPMVNLDAKPAANEIVNPPDIDQIKTWINDLRKMYRVTSEERANVSGSLSMQQRSLSAALNINREDPNSERCERLRIIIFAYQKGLEKIDRILSDSSDKEKNLCMMLEQLDAGRRIPFSPENKQVLTDIGAFIHMSNETMSDRDWEKGIKK